MDPVRPRRQSPALRVSAFCPVKYRATQLPFLTFDFDPENRGKKPTPSLPALSSNYSDPMADCRLQNLSSSRYPQSALADSQDHRSRRDVASTQMDLVEHHGTLSNDTQGLYVPDHFEICSSAPGKSRPGSLSREAAVDEDTDPSPCPKPTRPTRKRARSITPTSAPKRTAHYQTTAMNYPTMSAMMRGITVAPGDKRRAYKIVDKSIIIDPNVAGHNGPQMGQWWPLRHCAFRDGAHGSVMSGIAGVSVPGLSQS